MSDLMISDTLDSNFLFSFVCRLSSRTTDCMVLLDIPPREKSSPRPASMFPALSSLAPLREEEAPVQSEDVSLRVETPVEIDEDGFILVVPDPASSRAKPSRLVSSSSSTASSSSKPSSTASPSSKPSFGAAETAEIAAHRRNSFLHGSRKTTTTTTTTTRAKYTESTRSPISKSASPLLPSTSTKCDHDRTNDNDNDVDENANFDINNDNDDADYENVAQFSSSSRRDYVQLDPNLVKQFEAKCKSASDSPYYSQPPFIQTSCPDNDNNAGGNNDNVDNKDNIINNVYDNNGADDDYEFGAEALGDDDSSYDRLLHFTRRQFQDSKDELRLAVNSTASSSSSSSSNRRSTEERNGLTTTLSRDEDSDMGPGVAVERSASTSTTTTTTVSQRHVGFQFRGPSPAIPPHNNNNNNNAVRASAVSVGITASGITGITALTTPGTPTATTTPLATPTTQYATPDNFSRGRRVEEKDVTEIPPYAIGFLSQDDDDDVDDHARRSSADANPQIANPQDANPTPASSVFHLLPDARVRSSSEPSICEKVRLSWNFEGSSGISLFSSSVYQSATDVVCCRTYFTLYLSVASLV